MSRKLWTDKEETDARILLRRGYSFKAIGAMLGRSANSVYNKMDGHFKPTEKVQIVHRPLPEQLAERDRRMALPVRDLTAEFCGDPRVGESALERRA